MEMLVFEAEDAERVLKAMRSAFTTENGFVPKSIPIGEGEVNWVFRPAPRAGTASVGMQDGEAIYASGRYAAQEEYLIENGLSETVFSPQDSKTACIVILIHERNWIDRGLDSMRAFLHIG